VPGLSENIRVVSVLGRFLEHSRIYYFHNNGNDEAFIGSADWMVRNLDYRVEAITPIEDKAHQQELRHILQVSLDDQSHAWELQPDGTWKRTNATASSKGKANAEGTQAALMRLTLETHRRIRRP
jgi:polyphosphate kinase